MSTTQPNNNKIPYFNKWFLSFAQQNNSYNSPKLESVSVQKNNRLAEDKEIQAYEMATTSASYTSVSVQQLSINYEVSIPYDIYSNGLPHTVDLLEQNVPASYNYYAAPKLNKDVFLIAEIPNYSKYNLLNGRANIIFDNMFVGKTNINSYDTKDTLQITLGVDKNIVIKRDKLTEKSGNKILSSNRESTFVYEISVRNNKKMPISLVLKDQFPTSTDEKVIVDIVENSNAQIDNDTGTFTWNLEIKPDETKKIRLGYKVTYPKDKQIFNLQ
jgi:uncharacterized protein (TIGR02231 family)